MSKKLASNCSALVLGLIALLPAICQSPKHVIVFGVDGLSPAGIEKARTPNIHALMKAGSWTIHARSVMPTVSSPNWASMIMGAPTELTGVTSNDWKPASHTIQPACESAPGIFPTIFGLEHAQHPAAHMGIFTDWPDFVRLLEPDTGATIYSVDENEDEALSHALAYLSQTRPEFLFLHLDHVDNAGHASGWETPAYLLAVEKADRMLGEVLGMLDKLKIRDSTVILLTADHGGIEKRHGGLTMNEIEIPWIINGPGIRKDHEIRETVLQFDTAATLARLLEVRPSPCWRGLPVNSGFEDSLLGISKLP